MRLAKKIINLVITIVGKIFSILEVLLDGLEQPIKQRYLGLKDYIVEDERSMDETAFNQMTRTIWCRTRRVLCLIYPLAGLLYFIVRRHAGETKQKAIFRINRFLIPVFIIWGIINPLCLKGYQFDSPVLNIIVDGWLIGFNPLKALAPIIYFNVGYILRDFMSRKPEDWEMEQEREKEQLEEYDEYGDN